MRISRLIIVPLLFLCYPFTTFSQKNINYDPWDWITYRNSSYITSISEGNEFIYFGSNGGILRYHLFGRFWADPITSSQGLASENITAVYYDFTTNLLWGASQKKGLNYSIDGGRSWELVNREILGLRPGEKIVGIGSSPNYLWLLTTSQIMKVDHLSGYLIEPYSNIEGYEVNWGSFLLNDLSILPSYLNDFTATGGWINALGVLHGPHFEEAIISTLYADRFGDIWLGCWGGPAFYGDTNMKQLTPIPAGLAQTSVQMIVKQNNGFWIGGITDNPQTTGITYLELDRGIWEKYRWGIEFHQGSDQILCGVSVGEEIWFGLTDGILIYDESEKDWFHLSELKGLPDEHISCIDYDGDYVYVGTPKGIVKFYPKTRMKKQWILENILRHINIYDIHWDGINLWISAETGLIRWLPDEEEIKVYGISGEDILPVDPFTGKKPIGMISPITAIVSFDSVVYFGDENGILAFDNNREYWSRYTGKSQLIDQYFNDITVLENPDKIGKMIWLGTNNGTILFDVESDRIHQFRKNDGLPSNVVTSIIIDGDLAWLGTPNGLVKFKWTKYVK
ncbi:MAG: hypothetical protein H8E82_02620 [Candidatus Marinimicrobia bacterium]|nr:hypothetical protein [Candidatus Neomarinimicrobiota bacterium]